MKNVKLYKSPEIDITFLTGADVLSSSITGMANGFTADGYDLSSGAWW